MITVVDERLVCDNSGGSSPKFPPMNSTIYTCIDFKPTLLQPISQLVPNATVKGSVRKGMDLVRVGNVRDSGVAFFFDRPSMPPPAKLMNWLAIQVVPALAEVGGSLN